MSGLQTLDLGLHGLHFGARFAKRVKNGAQFGIGLGQLRHQLTLALLAVNDGGIARFLGLVQGLGKAVHLVHMAILDR